MRLAVLAVSLFLLSAFLLLETPAKRIPSFAGKYRALIARIDNTSEDYPKSKGETWIRIHSTQARGKQPQYGWGHFYSNILFTDNMRIEVRMASRSNNEWKKNAFVFNFGHGCSTSMIHAASLMRLGFGPDHNLTCPIKPCGLREIKNQTFELIFPMFPIMPYGRYQFTLAVIDGNEVLGVGVADGEVVPRL